VNATLVQIDDAHGLVRSRAKVVEVDGPSSRADRRGGPFLDFSGRGWQSTSQARLRNETSRPHTRRRVTGRILVDLPRASAP